ncbi:MAG: type I restriction enzyme HsdR N-terminal domain-containing protein [Saprospirales bacterium]|nr:MAG: type I restriction enzyme HsdR N-terminal domain-containing protein [Saprospirales bacterium]
MSAKQLSINLMKMLPSLRMKKVEGKDYIWDPTRQKYLQMQPEEFVRQLLIAYLANVHCIPIGRMKSEVGIKLNRTGKRCDLIVFDKTGKPFLLAECKSFEKMDIVLTAEQIERYNIEVKANCLLITNGPKSYFFKREAGSKIFLPKENIDLSEYS